jgi:hypothetical protein
MISDANSVGMFLVLLGLVVVGLMLSTGSLVDACPGSRSLLVLTGIKTVSMLKVRSHMEFWVDSIK